MSREVPGPSRPIVLGRVSGLFGVKGWVRIHSYTVPRTAMLDYPDWLVERGSEWKPIAVAEKKAHGKALIARFDGVSDRDAAAEWVDHRLGVRREALPDLENHQYYWSDLEGLEVRNTAGALLGTVAYLLETGANDVLVVRNETREILIPFVSGDVIKAVDLVEGEIRADWDWD